MTVRRKLRIGLLQDGSHANRYVRDLVTWANGQEDLEISYLIIHAPPEETRLGAWRRQFIQHRFVALRRGVFKCIRLLEQGVLRVYHGGKYRDHTRQYQIGHLIEHTLHINPNVSKSGLVYRFSSEEIAKVRAADCDVLIRGGKGILRGEILETTPFGILSFHHGDNRVNRGGPAGFWESYLGWPATGFVIQRLTAELDGGEVLVRGSYATKWFFLFNQAALFTKSNVHVKDLLKRLARERTLPPAEEASLYSARPFRSPSVNVCVRYLAKVTTRAIRRGIFSAFRYRERWSVSFGFTEWKRAVLWRAWTPAPPAGRFLADPFVWRHEGKTFCFVEDYSFRDRIGRISAFHIDKHACTTPEPVLVEPFHLSFPYLFEFNGTTYMCPECSASRQIRLYRPSAFPYNWEFVKAIMTDVTAVDTMLFERGGRWWMLTNLDRAGEEEDFSELYLFSAASPLSESWVAHPANPLKIDPEGGRNAGLLRDGNRLYRAGQVQGFDRYGVGIRLYEISSLSPEHYREHLIAVIQPGFRERLLGTHHVSSTDGVTVVDSVRREFVW
jgi:hypothetical protein